MPEIPNEKYFNIDICPNCISMSNEHSQPCQQLLDKKKSHYIYQYQILELFRRDIIFSQEFRDCGGDFKIPAFSVWLYFGKCFVIHA